MSEPRGPGQPSQPSHRRGPRVPAELHPPRAPAEARAQREPNKTAEPREQREPAEPREQREPAEPASSRERTSKGERSRQRLIEATAALLRKQGFHGTGLAEIVQTSGAPRGSLYFYFPGGKEELACAALAESGAALRQLLGQVIDDAGDPAAAVEQVCHHLAAALAASGWEQGCPLATVALEAAASSPQVRETCAAHFSAWIELISERLARAGVAPELAQQFATFGLAAIEGALLLAKVHRDPQPLYTTGAMLRRLVAGRLPGGAPPMERAERGERDE